MKEKEEVALKKVRTRFAPSPTGYMHIGNLRTALYAYLFAKHHGGDFVLRIEDTDQKRFVEGATQVIYDSLDTIGMKEDEGPRNGGEFGPYVQSERKKIYGEYARELVKRGGAYYCFCQKEENEIADDENAKEAEKQFGHSCDCSFLTKEQVAIRIAKGEKYVIRQRIPKNEKVTFHDAVFGDITVDTNTLDEQVLIKSDGLPTYNFANVVDDHLMQISHVIRGNEYISSTPKYQLLYNAFGWEAPVNLHVSKILGRNEDGSISKLSKRHGAVSFANLVEMGYLPEAILNYVVLLGWSPKQEREIFSIDELIEIFDADGIIKNDAIFDYKKLAWMNGEYIKKLEPAKFIELSKPFIKKLIPCVKKKWKYAAPLAQGRINVLSEIPKLFEFLGEYGDFDLELFENKKNKLQKNESLEILKALLPKFESLENWNIENLNSIASDFAAEKNFKIGKAMWAPRIAVAGQTITPGGMGEMMFLLGKDESLARIKKSISRLESEK